MKRCGVYKYVHNGEIIYIGKSDSSIESRISGHSRESKFKPFLKKCEIYYAWLPNPAYTMIFETFLINKYKPHLNVSMKYDKILPFDIPEPYWQKYDKQLGCIYHTDDETKYSSNYSNQNELIINQYNQQISKLKHSQSEIINKLKFEYSAACKQYEDTINDLTTACKQYEDTINDLTILNKQQEHKIELIDICKQDRDFYKEMSDRATDGLIIANKNYLSASNKVLSCNKKIDTLEAEVASLRELLKNAKTSYDEALKKIKERDEKITQLKEINDIAEQNKEVSKKSFKSKIGRIFSLS